MTEPNWEGKDLDYACTLAKFAEQIGIQLWQAMAMMKYAEFKGGLMIQGFPKKKECGKSYECNNCPYVEDCEIDKQNKLIDECKSAVMKMLDKEKIKDVVFFPPYYPTEETWDEWSTRATQVFINYIKEGV